MSEHTPETPEKHPPFEEGRRHHVDWWAGVRRRDGTIACIRRCSEPKCEVNREADRAAAAAREAGPR